MFQKKPCPHCGNNPTPHYINWYFDTLNIIFERLQIGFLGNPLSRFLARYEDGAMLFIVGFLRLLGIVSLEKTPHKNTLSRARVLWEDADKRGLEMREVRLLGRSVDTYIVRKLDATT